MRNKLFHVISILVVALTMLTSCASHKKSTDVLKQENIVASGSITIMSGDNDMTAPAKLFISRGKLARLQVQMPLLGSEVVRVEFTPKNILVIDRMNKQYAQESYETLNNLTGAKLSFVQVQDMLLNYLAVQDELKIKLPTAKEKNVTLKGAFNDMKATEEEATPTEVSTKYKRMDISQLSKLGF